MPNEKVHSYHVKAYGRDSEIITFHYTGTKENAAACLFSYVLEGFTVEIYLEV
jgi:hypothetical protein